MTTGRGRTASCRTDKSVRSSPLDSRDMMELLSTDSGFIHFKGGTMCAKQSTAMTWQDVCATAKALEVHTGGHLDILLTPQITGFKESWTASVYLNVPKLQGVGRSLCLLADGQYPGGDFRSMEALCYYLIHQIDVEYQRMHTQATLDNLAW